MCRKTGGALRGFYNVGLIFFVIYLTAQSFYGLSVGKEVHLKYAYNVRCDSLVKDASGLVVELICTVDFDNINKPKGNLQWVSSAVPGKVYIFEIFMLTYKSRQ